MNVAILSMQHVNNFGSVLQAYALSKIIQSFECNVSFLDIKRIDEDYKLLGDCTNRYSGETEKNGFISKVRKLASHPINRIDHKYKERKQDYFFEEFRKKNLLSSNSKEKIDLCVIGSDEVFNCLNAGYWGFSSQLFGNVQECNRIITYAASCGATLYNDVPEIVLQRISESFDRVSGFSVRDKNTYDFVSKLSHKTIMEHLDPVLIYDFEKEIEQVDMPNLPDNYCVIYSYRNRINDKREIRSVSEFCKKNNLIPVSIGAPQYWTKEYIPCSPFECLKIFRNAPFVITDTFHGTIFSYKYSNKFAIIRRESNYNKLTDLVNRLNLKDYLIENNSIDWIYKNCNHKQCIDHSVDHERERTISYLSGYLSNLNV